MHVLIKGFNLFLSKKFQAAVKVLVWLAARSEGGYARSSDVCRGTGLHSAEYRAVFTKLVRYQILDSKKGYGGGVALALAPEEISLSTVREIVDEENAFRGCLSLSEERAHRNRISLHAAWQTAKAKVLRESKRVSLARLTRKIRRIKTRSPAANRGFFFHSLYSMAA